MNKYGYVLKKNMEKKEIKRYRRDELYLMTIYQLKEICRREKLIHGITNPMDKEELIQVILRYRGAEEYYLIKEASEEGEETLAKLWNKIILTKRQNPGLECRSKIILWERRAVGFYDGLTIPYREELAGTNALVVADDGTLCTILNIETKGDNRKALYLTKEAKITCREAGVKNYSLYCMNRHNSEILYRLYYGLRQAMPEHMEVYQLPLLALEVRKPISLSTPLAVDFGSSNTTAGVYLDQLYFESAGLQDGTYGLQKNAVNYARFYDVLNKNRETALFPSVVSVLSADAQNPQFVFGYEAIRLANSSYIDEGFCLFYDIKRWIGDYERQEEITDSKGKRGFVKRKDILKAYLSYIITGAEDRFKCEVKSVHISCPVKQKEKFQLFFQEILPQYTLENQVMLDEGVSVLYSTISQMLEKGKIHYGEEYKALILDCGGGTTDVCSCHFRVWDKRVSYRIEIDAAYENGDTDFGGNNLTYRIMQYIKLAVVHVLQGKEEGYMEKLLEDFGGDIYRRVDETDVGSVYEKWDMAYKEAECLFPTAFKSYEQRSRADYYRAKNNFFLLFHLAEKIKKEFYTSVSTIRVVLSSTPIKDNATTWIPVDKWKMAVETGKGQGLGTVKEFPPVYLTRYGLELLLKADIYGIVSRFMGQMYELGQMEEYSLIKLTGQSCKIDVFRDALKEFVPGRTIQFRPGKGKEEVDDALKMTCVDGALRYLRDKQYGLADVVITTGEPALPYSLTAFTHSGEEVTLIHSLKKGGNCGMISRNMEELLLKLYLKDSHGREKYEYTLQTSLADFQEMSYEQIKAYYGKRIKQAYTDDIINREVKFFVWAKPMDWAFKVVPIYRKEERLYVGREVTLPFENDGWVQNFFDGTR